MKCRYNKCKLGGEVARENAVVDGRMYYHEECYKKKIAKERIRELLKEFPVKDVNIALSKAIDANNYPVEFVEYVATNKRSKLKSAYNLLYQLKIEDNYKEYIRTERGKLAFKINQEVQNMDLEVDQLKFNYKPSKIKGLDIY